MGTLHYLLKMDHPEYFDLGKSLYFVFNSTNFKPFILPQLFTTPSDLQKSISREILEGFWTEETKTEPYHSKFCSALANKIFEWAKFDRLLLVSDNDISEIYDCFDYEPYKSYNFLYRDGKPEETGSRYIDI